MDSQNFSPDSFESRKKGLRMIYLLVPVNLTIEQLFY